jgi:hypothetical protein
VPARRPNPPRGLLAGLVVLVAFAWFAVAMTTGGSRTNTPSLRPALTAQTAVVRSDGAGIAGGADEDRGRDDGEHLR